MSLPFFTLTISLIEGKLSIFIPALLSAWSDLVVLDVCTTFSPRLTILCSDKEDCQSIEKAIKRFIRRLKEEFVEFKDALPTVTDGSDDRGHIVIDTISHLDGDLERDTSLPWLQQCQRVFIYFTEKDISSSFTRRLDALQRIMSQVNTASQLCVWTRTAKQTALFLRHLDRFRPAIITPFIELAVVHDIEFVPEEHLKFYMLDVIQKTAPPVQIFVHTLHDADRWLAFLADRGVSGMVLRSQQGKCSYQTWLLIRLLYELVFYPL